MKDLKEHITHKKIVNFFDLYEAIKVFNYENPDLLNRGFCVYDTATVNGNVKNRYRSVYIYLLELANLYWTLCHQFDNPKYIQEFEDSFIEYASSLNGMQNLEKRSSSNLKMLSKAFTIGDGCANFYRQLAETLKENNILFVDPIGVLSYMFIKGYFTNAFNEEEFVKNKTLRLALKLDYLLHHSENKYEARDMYRTFDLNMELEAKQKELDELSEKLKEAEGKITQLENLDAYKFQCLITKSENEVEELKLKNKELEEDIESKDKRIENLGKQVNTLMEHVKKHKEIPHDYNTKGGPDLSLLSSWMMPIYGPKPPTTNNPNPYRSNPQSPVQEPIFRTKPEESSYGIDKENPKDLGSRREALKTVIRGLIYNHGIGQTKKILEIEILELELYNQPPHHSHSKTNL